MVTEFEDGETYTNAKLDRDVMVLGKARETAEDVTFAVLWVDRESKETNGGGELTIKKSEFADWSEVEI